MGQGAGTETVELDLGSAPCISHVIGGKLLKHVKEQFLL